MFGPKKAEIPLRYPEDPPPCPYGIAHRRAYGLSTSGSFRVNNPSRLRRVVFRLPGRQSLLTQACSSSIPFNSGMWYFDSIRRWTLRELTRKSHTHSSSLSLSHTLAHTHTLALTLSLSLSLSLSLALSLPHTHTLSFSLSLSYTHTHTPTYTHSLSPSTSTASGGGR